MTNQDSIFWLIIALASVTYLGRLLGYVFIKTVKPTPRIEAFLQQVPGTIFIAMVTPKIIEGGPVYWLGAAVTLAVSIYTKNLFIALLLGMTAYFIGRSLWT